MQTAIIVSPADDNPDNAVIAESIKKTKLKI
jgi:hypothetical protein